MVGFVQQNINFGTPKLFSSTCLLIKMATQNRRSKGGQYRSPCFGWWILYIATTILDHWCPDSLITFSSLSGKAKGKRRERCRFFSFNIILIEEKGEQRKKTRNKEKTSLASLVKLMPNKSNYYILHIVVIGLTPLSVHRTVLPP